jgi:protein-S-isoprenylcysteine O-methyltransferase Ste14
MGRAMPDPHRTRLPSLGPRGEGWVALQSVLLVVLVMSGTLGPAAAGPVRAAMLIIGAALAAAGIGLGVAGVLQQRRQFTTLPRPRSDAALLVGGPYRLVRHPMYGGIVLAGFGWALVTASPVTLGFAVVAVAFFDLKSRREEVWLEDQFPGYPAYRARTRRLIPFLY